MAIYHEQYIVIVPDPPLIECNPTFENGLMQSLNCAFTSTMDTFPQVIHIYIYKGRAWLILEHLCARGRFHTHTLTHTYGSREGYFSIVLHCVEGSAEMRGEGLCTVRKPTLAFSASIHANEEHEMWETPLCNSTS